MSYAMSVVPVSKKGHLQPPAAEGKVVVCHAVHGGAANSRGPAGAELPPWPDDSFEFLPTSHWICRRSDGSYPPVTESYHPRCMASSRRRRPTSRSARAISWSRRTARTRTGGSVRSSSCSHASGPCQSLHDAFGAFGTLSRKRLDCSIQAREKWRRYLQMHRSSQPGAAS